MKNILSNIKIPINEKIFIKDPDTSDLGKKIIEKGIDLIDEIGFDSFTFKKLGEKIGSNESSIYRYFENKHKLLMYISSWYWGWIEYKLVFLTNSIPDSKVKLKTAIEIISSDFHDDFSHEFIKQDALFRIVSMEFSKSYLTKMVDFENKEGYFLVYKNVINRVVDIAEHYDPSYPYHKSLISCMIEGAVHQHFLKNHLTTITNCNTNFAPSDFYKDLIFRVLKN